jgi:phytoene synthase
LAQGGPVDAADAAGHLGVAQVLAGHLRAFGYNAARGRIFLPISILTANGVAESDILAGRSSEALTAALIQMRDLAVEHLALAQTAIRALPGKTKPVFAPASLLPMQLHRLARAGATPFVGPPDLDDWQKLAILAWCRWATR